MLVKPNLDGKIFAKAHLVRANNRALNTYRLEGEKVLKYSKYYNNPNEN